MQRGEDFIRCSETFGHVRANALCLACFVRLSKGSLEPAFVLVLVASCQGALPLARVCCRSLPKSAQGLDSGDSQQTFRVAKAPSVVTSSMRR